LGPPLASPATESRQAVATVTHQGGLRMSSPRDRTALAKVRARPRKWAEARAILLKERGVSLAKVARALGKDLSSVSRVNRGQRRSQGIEAAIARRLGLSVEEAFPEWRHQRSFAYRRTN
jgi:lambda repressor-like predicted transcriptional regulator